MSEIDKIVHRCEPSIDTESYATAWFETSPILSRKSTKL